MIKDKEMSRALANRNFITLDIDKWLIESKTEVRLSKLSIEIEFASFSVYIRFIKVAPMNITHTVILRPVIGVLRYTNIPQNPHSHIIEFNKYLSEKFNSLTCTTEEINLVNEGSNKSRYPIKAEVNKINLNK
jgi:hypothetical protein